MREHDLERVDLAPSGFWFEGNRGTFRSWFFLLSPEQAVPCSGFWNEKLEREEAGATLFRVLEVETGAGDFCSGSWNEKLERDFRQKSRAGAEALSRSQKKLAVEEGQGDVSPKSFGQGTPDTEAAPR